MARLNNIKFELRNSRYNRDYMEEHRKYLLELNIATDAYIPIVVNGKIEELSKWMP